MLHDISESVESALSWIPDGYKPERLDELGEPAKIVRSVPMRNVFAYNRSRIHQEILDEMSAECYDDDSCLDCENVDEKNDKNDSEQLIEERIQRYEKQISEQSAVEDIRLPVGDVLEFERDMIIKQYIEKHGKPPERVKMVKSDWQFFEITFDERAE